MDHMGLSTGARSNAPKSSGERAKIYTVANALDSDAGGHEGAHDPDLRLLRYRKFVNTYRVVF